MDILSRQKLQKIKLAVPGITNWCNMLHPPYIYKGMGLLIF